MSNLDQAPNPSELPLAAQPSPSQPLTASGSRERVRSYGTSSSFVPHFSAQPNEDLPLSTEPASESKSLAEKLSAPFPSVVSKENGKGKEKLPALPSTRLEEVIDTVKGTPEHCKVDIQAMAGLRKLVFQKVKVKKRTPLSTLSSTPLVVMDGLPAPSIPKKRPSTKGRVKQIAKKSKVVVLESEFHPLLQLLQWPVPLDLKVSQKFRSVL